VVRCGRTSIIAARLLRVNPGFAATAVLSLALGIAANTSIFTLVDQILLRLLPVENPRELVQFRMEGGRFGSQSGDGLHTFSYRSTLPCATKTRSSPVSLASAPHA
jgi:hypothetical protein